MSAVDRKDGELQRRLGKLEEAVAHTRALVGAVYDRLEDGPAKLAAARATESWRSAYSETEPLVSVTIPTWNRAGLLVERALASVQRQTYVRWEAVVVGDGCSDDTEERLAALDDSRVRFHNRPVNGPYPEGKVERWRISGVPAMAEAVQRAKGTWIAPLEDDDEWDDDHLEVLLGTALKEKAEFAYGRLRSKLDGRPTDRSFGAWPPREGQVSLGAAIYNAALRTFKHDEACRFVGEAHDWNLVRRLWDAGARFSFVDRALATYHMDHVRQHFSRERP